jgi:hypothetical protein
MSDRRRWSRLTSDPWLKWAARFGYAACGVIYIAIGFAAASVALGFARHPKGSEDVMLSMARQPFGELVVIALGVGLAGYAALNFAGAINDPEGRGVSLYGLAIRAADALTGALYIALAVAALGIVVTPETNSINPAVGWAAKILGLPFGAVILGLIGSTLMVSSVYLLYRAWTEPFGNMLDRRSISSDARKVVRLAARAGTAVRAVIFGICGFFVLRAAASRMPERVGDVADALAALGRGMIGPVMLGVAAAGFIAYGGYQLTKARYQRIAPAPRVSGQ